MPDPEKAKRREELYALLGDLPPRDRPVGATRLREEECGNCLLESLLLDLNGEEPVPAYFIRPKTGDGPFPTVVFNHWHGGQYGLGKRQLLEPIQTSWNRPYADELAARGYAALAIDAWLFGERSGLPESHFFKEMLWKGRVVWGMMVYDSLRAVDYLHTRDDVDAARLGTLGMSMGSTMAWWLAALDPRIRVCIDICCLSDYATLIETRGLDCHGLYYYVPGLLKHFSTAEINALIAPRPHLALAGNHDVLTPPAGLDAVDAALREVYAAEDASEAWKLVRYNVGHTETEAMRVEIVRFLEKWLATG